jgi:hypothetical protein
VHEQEDPKKIKIDSGKYFIRTLTIEDASDRLASWFSDANVLYALNASLRIWSKDDVVNYINDFNHASKLLLGILRKQAISAARRRLIKLSSVANRRTLA